MLHDDSIARRTILSRTQACKVVRANHISHAAMLFFEWRGFPLATIPSKPYLFNVLHYLVLTHTWTLQTSDCQNLCFCRDDHTSWQFIDVYHTVLGHFDFLHSIHFQSLLHLIKSWNRSQMLLDERLSKFFVLTEKGTATLLFGPKHVTHI